MGSIFEYGKAICYSGYRKGQSPMGEAPTKEQIAEDIKILVDEGYKYVRMYDPNIHARYVCEIIRENNYDIKCIVGMDSVNEVNNKECPFEKQEFTDEELQAHIARNDGERVKLIALAKEFSDVIIAVSVGNENTPVWTAHKVPTERLLHHIREIKSQLDIPVTFCEGCSDWLNIPEVAAEVDFISGHSYPYHCNVEVKDAVQFNRDHLKLMKETFPDKEFIFTEMGWSSCVSLDDESTYDDELFAWLEEDKVVGFVFEAFDELWKGPTPESSECCFGIYNENRQRKW